MIYITRFQKMSMNIIGGKFDINWFIEFLM